MSILGNLIRGNQQPTQPQQPANNPLAMADQLNQTMDYINQNGGNAEALVRQLAAQRGVDVNELLEKAKVMEQNSRKLGFNLNNLFGKRQ